MLNLNHPLAPKETKKEGNYADQLSRKENYLYILRKQF
jgi:hypothetical protein